METTAVLKYARISSQKVRRIISAVKGVPVEKSLSILKFMPQRAARILEKIINSAVANANQKANVDIDLLFVSNVVADQGPTLKRFRARARGRGTRILKRTSHIKVVISAKS